MAPLFLFSLVAVTSNYGNSHKSIFLIFKGVPVRNSPVYFFPIDSFGMIDDFNTIQFTDNHGFVHIVDEWKKFSALILYDGKVFKADQSDFLDLHLDLNELKFELICDDMENQSLFGKSKQELGDAVFEAIDDWLANERKRFFQIILDIKYANNGNACIPIEIIEYSSGELLARHLLIASPDREFTPAFWIEKHKKISIFFLPEHLEKEEEILCVEFCGYVDGSLNRTSFLSLEIMNILVDRDLRVKVFLPIKGDGKKARIEIQ